MSPTLTSHLRKFINDYLSNNNTCARSVPCTAFFATRERVVIDAINARPNTMRFPGYLHKHRMKCLDLGHYKTCARRSGPLSR